MKKNTLIAFIVLIFGCSGLFSQENFKVMFYNLLNFPLQEPATTRLQNLEVILSDYQPDIFMVCELNNVTGANSILNAIQTNINPDFDMATFVTNSSDDAFGDQNDLQNLIFYDSTKFILVSQVQIPTLYRDFNHYILKLNTVDQDTNPQYLHAIVAHLKASQDDPNPGYRLQMVQDLTTYLNSLPSDSYVILAGDMNLYTSSEPAFQELTDVTNNITFVDPANRVGSWHTNSSFLDVFTQSTRTTDVLGGAGGGFDDRFDFIFTSENMLADPNLYYVNNSYQVYGNNNNINCFNQEINSASCSGSDYSLTIRDALYNFSDHLPVTVQIETNETLLNTIEDMASSNMFEIVGANLIENDIKIKLNTITFNNRSLNFYNTLGQIVKTINTDHSTFLTINLSNLTSGIYYIASPSMNVEPLKFVKIN